ncbi:hypothetical protein P20652_1381 [Pseudoalteromonas sp. BSi20652]|nr:hypothetical protein P20652_1381 [Pseudoalteromonas sp. BSi20652]
MVIWLALQFICTAKKFNAADVKISGDNPRAYCSLVGEFTAERFFRQGEPIVVWFLPVNRR